MSERAKRGDAWKAILGQKLASLQELFQSDPDRLDRLTAEVAGVHFDWSKTHLDGALIEAFEQLADEREALAIVVDGDEFLGLITRIDVLNWLRRRTQP